MDALLLAIFDFSLYFFGALGSLFAFKWLFTMITPHDEWQLIKEQKNTAAAIGFGGSILGFALALAGVISNSISLLDFATWAVVALIAQLIAFAMLRFIFMPAIVTRIENDEVSAGIMLAAVSISVGILNAACVTY